MTTQLFTSQPAAARELQSQISAAVGSIEFPGGLGADKVEIVQGIMQNVDANVFDKHNQSGIVQVRAEFIATRSDGTRAFKLHIIWDADNPPVGSVQTAHYGWELHLEKQRIAGPAHVFFAANVILPHYRNTQRTQVEDASLKLSKSGTMGTGKMESNTQYFKLQKV